MVKKNLRDLIGYGARGKKISWPNNAKLALQIVLNYEEGGENSTFAHTLKISNHPQFFLLDGVGAKSAL